MITTLNTAERLWHRVDLHCGCAPMISDWNLVTEIASEIDRIPLIDTHEHTAQWDDPSLCNSSAFDVLRGTFVVEDLHATGMPQDQWKLGARDGAMGWTILKDRLNSVRNTAYYRALLRALRDLYDTDFDEIDERTWRLLSDRVSAAYKRPGWCKHVLRDRCHIEVALWDRVEAQRNWTALDRDLFVPVLRLDKFLFAYRAQVREELGRTFGSQVLTFHDCRDLLESVINAAPAQGIGAVKCNAAYHRDLRFDPSDAVQAAKVFSSSENDISLADAKLFEDYMMDFIVQGASRLGLPIQVHTGMLSGPGYLAGSNSMLLAGLIQRHPKANFVLFHGGYPFTTEVAILAKSFPNVYLDANWLPLISPTAMKRAFHEWLDSIPLCKIFIWGGDSYRVESTYASLLQVKQVVSEVLAEKVGMGHLSRGQVSRVLWDIFRNNAAQFYKTDSLRNWRPGAVNAVGHAAGMATPTTAT